MFSKVQSAHRLHEGHQDQVYESWLNSLRVIADVVECVASDGLVGISQPDADAYL